MASSRPPAGVIPAGHPTLAGLWRLRQARGTPFRHLHDLIAVLYIVEPGVVEDPDFLGRSVLVDGLRPSTTRDDLLDAFPLLSARAAVLVRDSETGHRVGLVAFSDAADSTRATRMTPRPGFYYTCIPASSHGNTRRCILDALEEESARRPTAQQLRALVPPQYLVDDEDMDIHLRCVLLGGAGAGGASGGAYGLCRAARDVLLARGYVRAVILWRAGDIGVLVFDDAETTELLARRAPRLLHQCGLRMHDSSLFPLPADAASGEASLLGRLLPPFLTPEDYRCRVMLLTGVDTEMCDAAELAYCIQHRIDLIYEKHAVEAVIVHRSQRIVLVVLGSCEATEILLQEPAETWVCTFGRPVAWISVFGQPVVWPRQQGCVLDDPRFSMRDVVSTEAFEDVRDRIIRDIRRRRDDEIARIVRCLIGLCALSDPGVVCSSDFPHRALLLSGIDLDTSWSELCCNLSTFGMLDDVVLDGARGMALAVYRSWSGAARLLRQSTETWERLGFHHCRPAPEVENAGIIADKVVYLLLDFEERAPTT